MADRDKPLEYLPADLSSGDGKARGLDCGELEVARIASSDAPLFAEAYYRLWAEFGAQREMESRDVILQRLGWPSATKVGDSWLRYEMVLVRRKGQFVAVRDHTAVVPGQGGPRAVVHLSHVLVHPAWRRTGLAGWLRAWPIQTARSCLSAAGLSVDAPITLAAEMEHPDPAWPNRMIRLKAYERAGFKKVDPGRISYFQPDFRAPHLIDAEGGPQPLPFGLVVRRVARAHEQFISGGEVREIVRCLYRMYGAGFRPQDMAGLWQRLEEYPPEQEQIPLVLPTDAQ